MKQFPLLLLLALFLTLAACGDDDDTVTPVEPTPPTETSVDVNLNFTASYGDEPFVIGETYTYEDDTPIFFTRLNFFISNVSLVAADGSTVEISAVEFIDFTEQNIDVAGANEGNTIEFPSTLIGEYTGMKFGVGVGTDLNATDPTDYSSTHPLGNILDYWSAWNSYIFGKLEGKVDVNLDGTFTSGIVYHTGGNEYYNEVEFDAPITIDANNSILPSINIDAKRLLVRSDSDYMDIINNSAVHNDGDGILMRYVVQNYLQAIELQ